MRVPSRRGHVCTRASYAKPQDPDDVLYRRVKLLYPSGDPSRPFEARRFSQISRRDLMTSSKTIGETLVPLRLLQGAGQPLGDLELTPLSRVELQDGGEYVVVSPANPLEPMVRELAGWQRTTVQSHEHDDGEIAVRWMRSHGRPDARRICVQRLTSSSGSVEAQVDTLVVSSHDALLLESKERLEAHHPLELAERLGRIRYIANEANAGNVARELAGKDIMLVLAGRTVTTNQTAQAKLKEQSLAYQIELWLPDGSGGLGPSSSCFPSPYRHFPDEA